jgi:alpha-tubulin suppressor-like RCC1 family protein
MGVRIDGECDVGSCMDIIQIAIGTFHTVRLKSDGTVVAVGPEGGDWDFRQCDVGDWMLN